MQHSMRYVVLRQDTVPAGYEPYQPLHFELSAEGEVHTLEIDLGVMSESCTCIMTLGIAGTVGFCKPGVKLVQCTVERTENAKYHVLLRSLAKEVIKVQYCEIFMQVE